MALKDNPYLPLYTKDFSTDEKLRECSAQSVGVFIFLMCLFHKQDQYGKILLKQNDKQTDNQILNFAYKIGKHLPYNHEIIYSSLIELLDNNVIKIDGDFIYQKRMVEDNKLSEIRATVGSNGGKKTAKKFAKAKVKAKLIANTDIEIDNEIEIDIDNKNKIDLSFVDFEYLEVFELWLEYKKEKKQSYKSQKSLEICYKNLIKIANNDPEVARQIISNSIANNYSGLFPIKQNKEDQPNKFHNLINLYNQTQEEYANKPRTGKKFGEL